jgi:hypothetical protein
MVCSSGMMENTPRATRTPPTCVPATKLPQYGHKWPVSLPSASYTPSTSPLTPLTPVDTHCTPLTSCSPSICPSSLQLAPDKLFPHSPHFSQLLTCLSPPLLPFHSPIPCLTPFKPCTMVFNPCTHPSQLGWRYCVDASPARHVSGTMGSLNFEDWPCTAVWDHSMMYLMMMSPPTAIYFISKFILFNSASSVSTSTLYLSTASLWHWTRQACLHCALCSSSRSSFYSSSKARLGWRPPPCWLKPCSSSPAIGTPLLISSHFIVYLNHGFFLATKFLDSYFYYYSRSFHLVVFLLGNGDVTIWDMGGWSGGR